MVGAVGFEPTTSWSQTMRAQPLRHAPFSQLYTGISSCQLSDLYQRLLECGGFLDIARFLIIINNADAYNKWEKSTPEGN
jgi:hypothetical protein